jgi:polysaccharide export outer membrane protein
MRLGRFFVVLMSVLALAACARSPARQQLVRSDLDALMYGAPPAPSATVRYARHAVVPVRAAAAIPENDGPYRLDAGDRLRVVVFGQDTLSNTYTVDAAGAVTLPLIGAVSARGLTTSQLSAALAGRLKQSFIRDPSVAVEVDTYRPFFVLGEVTYPGQYPYVPNMTAETAVAIAGGFTPRAAKSDVTVTRKIDGVPVRYAMPLRNPLQPGDTITVAERWF